MIPALGGAGVAVAMCDTAPMSEFSAREIVASYIERIWNRGDSSAVLEFCADPYTRHDAGGVRVMSHTDQLHRVTSERAMGTAADGRSLQFETLLLAGDGQDVTWVWNMTGPTGTELAESGVTAGGGGRRTPHLRDRGVPRGGRAHHRGVEQPADGRSLGLGPGRPPGSGMVGGRRGRGDNGAPWAGCSTRLSWLVTVRPLATLAVLATITIALGAGIPQRAPQADNEIFLSDDSDVAVALSKLEALFGDSAETVSVTLVFRGEALTPEGLAQIERVIDGITSDPRVKDVLAAGDAVTSPADPVAAVLGVDGFADTTQGEIDGALDRIRQEGEFAGQRRALDSLTGTSTKTARRLPSRPSVCATPGTSRSWSRRSWRIHDITEEMAGPLAGRSVSEATIDEESDAATGLDDAAADGSRAAGHRGADVPVHALAIGRSAYARGTAGHDRVDHGGAGVAGAERAGLDRAAEHPDHDGADHADRPGGGLRDPDGRAVPRTAKHWRTGGARGAQGAAYGHDPAGAGGRDDRRQLPDEPGLIDPGERRLRHYGGTGRGLRPDRDADADPGRQGAHRQASRVAGAPAPGASDRKRAARHRRGGGGAGARAGAEAGALPRGCGGGDGAAGACSHPHRLDLRHARLPAIGRDAAATWRRSTRRSGARRRRSTC